MAHTALVLVLALLPPQRVVEIQIQGNRRVPESTIRMYLDVLKDHPPEPARLREAFQALWDTGLFDDIQFREDQVGAERVRLIVEVVERPLLREIRFEGDRPTQAPGEEDLLSRLQEAQPDLRAGRLVSEVETQRAAAALSRLLDGRYEVEAKREPAGEGAVDVVFTLARRQLPRIEAIELRGNRALTGEELRDAMELRGSNWASWIRRHDRFSPEALEADLDRLRKLYRGRGYYAVEVGPPEVEHVEKGRVQIVIPIHEGDRYRLGRLDLFPGLALTVEQARARLSLSPGDVYDANAVQRFAESLEELYRDRGYAAVEVVPFEEVVPSDRSINLSVEVIPGPPFHVRAIEFLGNRRTSDQRMRRYLALQEGELYSGSAVRASIRRLRATGYFRSVQPEVELRPESATVDLTIHVEEVPRFGYFVGGGANGVEGASANGVFRARDLLGRAETWTFSGDVGLRLQNGLIGYLEPFTLGKRLSWGASLEHRDIEYPDHTRDKFFALSGAVSGPSGGRWQFGAGFRFARFDLSSDLEGFVPFLTPFVGESFSTHRLQLQVGFEGRDRPVLPRRGGRLFVESELVGGFLGGDVELGRAGARATRFFSLDSDRRHLVRVAGRVGKIWPFGATDLDSLPRSERFFLGSEDDLRGFDIRAVGPLDDAGVPVGGDGLLYGGIEYQYAPADRLRFVGFFDLGNVYSSEPIGPELPLLRYDAGAELQLVTPLFGVPIRLGYGVNLDPLPDEPRGRFFFTLAARF